MTHQYEKHLKVAQNACYFIDMADAAARLSRANAPFGLAKIHAIQRALNLAPDATFVSTPDATVTRNLQRWASGMGYGGVFTWSGSFVPVELKPNVCGVAVMGLHGPPDMQRARRNIAKLASGPITVDGIEARWDVDHGNHFINVYEVDNPDVAGGFSHLVVMHASGRELRGPTPLGPGLYLDMDRPNEGLAAMVERIDTPFGDAVFVQGDAAVEYVAFAQRAAVFAEHRREAYLHAILDDQGEVLFNQMHQGLERLGRMVLGCYSTRVLRTKWVPVTLDADLPAYLVVPGQVYAERTMLAEGVLDRAKNSGHLERLMHADVLPHGGGYAYPEHDHQEVFVRQDENKERSFRFGDAGSWFSHPRGLAYAYRGHAVVDRLVRLGAGRVVAELSYVGALAG